MRRLMNEYDRAMMGGVGAAVRGLTWVLAALAIAAAVGCSRTNGPEAHGTISLRLTIDEPAPENVSPSPSQIMPDSVIVRVFRRGPGVTRETSSGAAINGPGDVDMTVTCIAESDKKVSVELFVGDHMVYFGVDEHVDVTENENTTVTIDAWDIYVNQVDVSPPTVVEGTAYNVSWTGAVAAASYLVLESTDPDFSQHSTQQYLTTDTLMTFQRPAGAYYYAVVPLNPYTVGSTSAIAYGYVQTVGEQPPQVTGVNPAHAAPGETVTVEGLNLDVPGRVLLGGVECPVVSTSETELVFLVPLSAYTGAVTLETLMGIVIPNPPFVVTVDRIAYVTRTGSDQDGYVQLIRDELSVLSGAAVVPLDEVADRDLRVFDVVVVSHDVADGPYGPGIDEVQAIANCGANVLAIGRGGQGYLALVFSEINGGVVAGALADTSLHVIESWPVFQAPEAIPVIGLDTVEISQVDQTFSSFDFGAFVPDGVTLYAALAGARTDMVLLDVVTTDGNDRTLHNFFWGHQGNAFELLPDTGQQLVINILSYLVTDISSQATPAGR